MIKVLIVWVAILFSLSGFSATYEVPGSQGVPPYQMKFKLKKKNGLYFTDYKLPLDLTGVENRIKANGSFDQNGDLVLIGKNGKLTCHLIARQCEAVYDYIVVDEEQVRLRFQARGLSEEEIKPFLAVSRKFGGDPIGVIHFNFEQARQAQ